MYKDLQYHPSLVSMSGLDALKGIDSPKPFPGDSQRLVCTAHEPFIKNNQTLERNELVLIFR